MDFIAEFIVEAFFGFFGDTVAEHFEKCFGSRRVIGIVFIILTLVFLVGLIGGIVLLGKTGGQNVWGWILVSLSVIYVIAMTVLKNIKKK